MTAMAYSQQSLYNLEIMNGSLQSRQSVHQGRPCLYAVSLKARSSLSLGLMTSQGVGGLKLAQMDGLLMFRWLEKLFIL